MIDRAPATLAVLLTILALAGCQGGAGGSAGPRTVASVDPARVMGLSAGELRSRLGEAELTQRAADGQLWQYRSDQCVFDMVLYPDGAGGEPRVSYTEARRRDGGSIAPARCLGQVVSQRGRADEF
jgi:hypothetical protein